MFKGQADVITAVIIILLAASLTTSAFLWGMPLVQKRQEVAMVEKVASYFDRDNLNSLVKKIEYVAKNGGEETFNSEVDGIWQLYPYDYRGFPNNSLEFMFRSKVTNIAPNLDWIPFKTSSLISPGYLGLDEVTVVLAKAESSDNAFIIRYRIWLRNITEDGKTYQIRLVPRNPKFNTSTGRSMRISRLGEPRVDATNKLIITEVQILFG
ncbi:MAG: hypothetical protein NZ942_01320 [Candidatus Aenigmarchaeota archaeon]|nr:hypothetical protein [Candidatus Aenigmarchaeota archaeon]